MDWLDRLERFMPWLDMPGLIRTTAFLMLIVFGLDMVNAIPSQTWILWGEALEAGQIWRAVTFLFVPTSSNPFFLMFELMMLVLIGDGLESAWGSFRLTVYYLAGALAMVALALIIPSFPIGSSYLNLTLFLAFATIYPDFEILVFFVLPVKIKYLGMLSGFFILWTIVTAPFAMKLMALLSVANYLVFFAPAAVTAIRRGAVNYNRLQKFQTATKPRDVARHVCSLCGKTERTNPELEFRYCQCSECEKEGRAFCLEHLKAHKKELEVTNGDPSC
ncbi:MAG: rhomboid family intramembrane serine protease [Candidatus Riflebacteria bacterium]|nr:rhomboid family intramembrane serine protease [Candidatus Riflebacteria bacterium]